MLSEINEKYQLYKEIHNRVLPVLDGDRSSELARVLLENSLYLSVFTTFENFLKNLIENYIYNKEKAGVKFIDLSERIAHSLFSNKESQIKFIFDDKNKNKNRSFDTFFKWLTENLDKKTLETHIHFEFLHKDKLNGYYKDLFQEILGDSEFLNNLELTQNVDDFGGLLNKQIQSNAATFLYEYTDKIRNNIAHENEKFKIGEYSSFDDIVDAFYSIIVKIDEEYRNNTGFDLEKEIKINMLDDC